MDLHKTYNCNLCDKKYKHRQSLNNHNRKFHSQNKPKNNILEHLTPKNEPKNNILEHFNCRYCNKEFKYRQSRNRHQKKCELLKQKENEELKRENEELKLMLKKQEKDNTQKIIKQEEENNKRFKQQEKEMKELRKQLLQLINKNGKIHYKTLQKINNNSNNTNSNNTIQNNINIIGFSNENIDKLFTSEEKLNIMKKRYMCLDYLIKYVHFNEKYPQLNNIKITNLRDNIAHKYNDEKKKFIATTKDELISDLISERMHDIEDFTFDEDAYERLDERNKAIIADLYEQFMDDDDFVNKRKDKYKLMLYNLSKDNE
jgi:uncharacterized protein with HEPN domain